MSFATFMCSPIGLDAHVLERDDSILCEGSFAKMLQLLSAVVIVFFALGMPVLFTVVLLRGVRQYNTVVEKVGSLPLDPDSTPHGSF